MDTPDTDIQTDIMCSVRMMYTAAGFVYLFPMFVSMFFSVDDISNRFTLKNLAVV